jgi:hypothetical protein
MMNLDISVLPEARCLREQEVLNHIVEKILLAHSNGLKGTMIWNIPSKEIQNILLNKGYEIECIPFEECDKYAGYRFKISWE